MTPEERKAIAKRMGQEWTNAEHFPECERRYPRCCSYHEGFDDALALLERAGVQHECMDPDCEWAFSSEPECDHAGPRLYVVEAPVTP